MNIGKRIRNLREKKGMSREEFAKRLGLSYWAVSKYENGERNPDAETLNKIADILGVTVDYLLGRNNNHSPHQRIIEAIQDDEELLEFWEELSKRDDLKLLFKQVKPLKPESIKTIIRIIKAIEDEEQRNQ